MKVFLLQSVPKVGMKNEIIDVSSGYARDYLIPRNMAVEVTPKNREALEKKQKMVEDRKSVINNEISMLAEKIKNTDISLVKKVHDDDKLYGSVTSSDIVKELKKHDISVAKNQVLFRESIKSKGSYDVTIKLSPKLKPTLTVNVVAE